jgi:hypothetical protein
MEHMRMNQDEYLKFIEPILLVFVKSVRALYGMGLGDGIPPHLVSYALIQGAVHAAMDTYKNKENAKFMLEDALKDCIKCEERDK